MQLETKVFKSNNLVNARYKLNPVELKIVLFVVSRITAEDTDFWSYSLKLDELGIRNEDIKASSRSLMSKVFEVKQPDGWLMVSWFSSIEYNGKKSTLEVQFDPKLKPYLLQLKEQFTAYTLATVLPMRSSYAIRLYELLKQYENIGHRVIDLVEFRDMLGIPKSYTFKDIRRRIIEPGLDDIHKYGDIIVTFEPIKAGRSYTALSFTIASKIVKETLKQYISRLRVNFANETLTRTKDKKTGKPIELSVSSKGLLYNKLDPDWHITKKRAAQIWKELQRSGICQFNN